MTVMVEEKTYLRQGQLIPNWQFTSTDGAPVSMVEYRQKKNVVLAFAGDKDCDHCRVLLRSLAAGHREIRAQDAEVLAVIAGSLDDARQVKARDRLPYTVVADEGGRVHREVGALGEGETPVVTVLVADRFGEVYSTYRESKHQALPTVGEIVDWLQFIELQCPE